MADKKLNEVTKVTNLNNVKTFLAVMNDNTIQQMSKEDMATVVEGLIGTATTDKNGLLSAKDKAFLYQKINGSYAVKIIDLSAIEAWNAGFCKIIYFNTAINVWGEIDIVFSSQNNSPIVKAQLIAGFSEGINIYLIGGSVYVKLKDGTYESYVSGSLVKCTNEDPSIIGSNEPIIIEK